MGEHSANGRKNVGLFVTCLVDLFRPSVGFASVKLLQQAGCDVDVPEGVTCCGQPAYNSGDKAASRALAEMVIKAYRPFDYVVAPSGSCAAMLKVHYPSLFEDDEVMRAEAESFSAKVHELNSFLVDVCGLQAVSASLQGRITYHDSCSGLRELGVREQPRQLLGGIDGLEISELKETEACCGFGGIFCVKYPDISNAMVEKKARDVEATGANMLLGGDLGCLMNIAGKLSRKGSPIEVRHVAEVLADELDAPPLSGPQSGKEH